MNNKNLQGIKKFKFFEDKPEEFDKNQKFLGYNLSDISIAYSKYFNKFLYIAGKPKKDKKAPNPNLFRIVKVHSSGKILEDYIPFTDSIISFDIINNEGRPFLVALGTDLRKGEKSKSEIKIKGNGKEEIDKIVVIPTQGSIPSIKLFDLTNLQPEIEEKNEIKEEKNEIKTENKIEEPKEIGVLKPNDVFYLMYRKDKKDKQLDLYKGNDLNGLTDIYEPITNISCFGVSPRLNAMSFSFQDSLVEIKYDYSLREKSNQFQYSVIKSKGAKNITNIKYVISGPECLLYFTTIDTIYYKKTSEKNVSNESNINSGADPQNFDVSPDRKILLSTSVTYYLEEYDFNRGDNSYEKLITKVFDRKIRFTQLYKNYYVFVIYEEEKPSLCAYDPLNNIFITLDESFKGKDILSILTGNDRIYVVYRQSETNRISSLKENDNKEKFDAFYKRQFFEVAYTFGKNLGYDKKKLSEISKLYAEHLYKKGDFEKSIEQYKLTINYLDPSYVIQKFLDGSKLNYLIDYLEALQNNEDFKAKCNSERLKDFTALLLNCYIKQKQIKKLKDFVEKKNIKDEVTIKTAIEVCKDTNKIDLALSIAQKAKMLDSFIQILMDIKNDFKESLETIAKITDIKKKFDLLIAYGEKFLEKKDVIDEAMKVISNLIDEIINIKKNNPNDERLTNLNYEKIISIFISKESEDKLEKLLDAIMEKDSECPKHIILRRIELYVDKYTENKIGSADKIKNILTNPKFKDKLDKNYLLMLFKISGFNQGVTELSKIMELDQDLLQIYMDQYEYQKINESCDEIMKKNEGKKKKVNYWLQALNYYISISSKSTISYLGKYIEEVLDHLAESKEEDFSPMILLDILKKARSNHGHIIEFKVIKKFIIKWIEKQQETLKNDKKETEDNYKKIEENNKQLKELQMTAKSYSVTRCPICGGALDIPFVYFICGHGYHQSCLNGESYEEVECSTCKDKITQCKLKIEDGRKLAKEPEKFYNDLKSESNENKFDVFASYLGKGIFINKNDEEEQQSEEQKPEINELSSDY